MVLKTGDVSRISMIYQFADCTLNTERHVFSKDGDEVQIEPQVFDVLRVLVENAGSLVTKDQLIEEVWDGRIISEAAISARINAARVATGDTGKDQKVIRTVPRRGFELVADVSRAEESAPVSSAARQTIRYARSKDGTSIAWSSAGDGPPLMLAWHHLGHLENDWNSPLLHRFMHGLADGRRMVRFDIRGAGLSDPLSKTATVDNQVDDFMAVADAAGLERFPVAAVMQGAAVALRVAARYPDRVSRLGLYNAYARGRLLRGGAPDSPEKDPFIALINSGGWGDRDSAFMRAWATMIIPSASPPEVDEMVRLIGSSSDAEDTMMQRTWIDALDVLDDLAEVTCPTLVVHARQCAFHPVQEGRRIAASVAGAEFIELNSANTICIDSDPATAVLSEAMVEFLAAD